MRVLVPLDGSELAERTLPYAAALARPEEGSVVLFHVRSAYGSAPAPGPDLEQVAEAVARTGAGVETLEYEHYAGTTGSVIVSAARDQHADLIAMSAHGRSGIGRWLFGSVADQVLRASDVPVLVVPAQCERRWPEGGPRRILVTLDGSDLARSVLGPAWALAERTGGSLILLRVVEPTNSILYTDPPAVYPSDEQEARFAEARDYVERIGENLPSSRVDAALAEVGSPVLTIDAVARSRDADLIAMATHGRGGVARLALGSVGTGVLQRASIPLLLTRPAAPGDLESATSVGAQASAHEEG